MPEAKARAKAVRCIMPPLSSLGRASARVVSRTMSSISARGCFCSSSGIPLMLRSEEHVLRHGQLREERIGLGQQDRPPVLRLPSGDVLAVEEDRSRIGEGEAADHAQRGGLARPGRAEDAEVLPIQHLQVQAVGRLDVAIGLPDLLQGRWTASACPPLPGDVPQAEHEDEGDHDQHDAGQGRHVEAAPLLIRSTM